MENIIGYFFPGECYEKVVSDYNFFDADCLKFALARYLSLSVVLGSIAVKLPQIIKILRSNSTENLSYMVNILELAACTFPVCYNYAKEFPFSTWGESFFVGVQVVIIIMLMCMVRKQLSFLLIFLPTYCGLVWYLTSEYVPMNILMTLQGSVVFLVIGSRMTQILTTHQSGTTGQLSFITAFMTWMGTAARVFTTIQETQDLLILTTFLVSTTVNTLVLFQFYWYWNVPTKTIDQKKKE